VPAHLTSEELDQFERNGFVRVHGAIDPAAVAMMQDVLWAELATRGILRGEPATWTVDVPDHLQHLKQDAAFQAVGSERTQGAISEVLGWDGWTRPTDWGAYFLIFPDRARRPWHVPWSAWHVDHDWTLPVAPLAGLKVHAMLGDVAPRAGGMTIVAGSHHVVAELVARHGLPDGTPAAKQRAAVMAGHPYLRDLGTPEDGDPDLRARRIARFIDAEEEVLGHPLHVAELTASAGDVILIHPLVLHTRPVNAGTAPRLLLNKDLYLRDARRSADAH
jgi:hypothetical protein